MKIAIGSDHAGYELKEFLKRELKSMGEEIFDYGCFDESPVDYPDYGFKVAEKVSSREVDFGILVCGTGLGMCVCANKVKGVRAALAYDLYAAIQSRRHLNANVLVLGGRMTGKELAMEIVKVFLSTPFEGGRHERRLGKIEEYERRCI